MWQKPERAKSTNDSCLKLQNGRSGFSETGSGFCRTCQTNQQFVHKRRFGFLRMHSKPEHEHKHARNGSAITAWFCNMHIRNNLVMPRARPYNAETAMNRNNDKNKSTNSNEKNNKNNNNNGDDGRNNDNKTKE